MSQQGYVTFFTTAEGFVPTAEQLGKLFDYLGVESICWPFVTTGESRLWDEFQELVKSGYDDILIDDTESLGKLTPGQVAEHIPTNGGYFCSELIAPAFHDRMQKVMSEAIDESIRGNCIPHGLDVYIGGHDLFDTVEDEDGHLFGRSQFSAQIAAYSSPNDWQRYRELLWEVPEIKEIHSELERIFGLPFDKCVFWNV